MDAVDVVRGLALLWMTLYHFGFDLVQFGYWQQDFYTAPLWTWQRTCILSCFLLCAGAGQALAVRGGQCWRRFGWRWLQIAGCALLVTVGSWWMFPRSFIYLGVLHGMALMLPLLRLGRPSPRAAIGLAVALLALFLIAPQARWTGAPAGLIDWLNSPTGNWLGLITHKPITEDYVPLLPWLSVMLLGYAGADRWLQRLSAAPAHRSLAIGRVRGLLAWLGRHSLAYYMLHQPVLIGALMLAGWLRAA